MVIDVFVKCVLCIIVVASNDTHIYIYIYIYIYRIALINVIYIVCLICPLSMHLSCLV